jgi:glycosyltransferase involved in cell wall biosynthesis
MSMSRLRLVVDGVYFPNKRYGITRLWRSVLSELIKLHPIELIILDRGDAPDIAGSERVPFPSYSARSSAQDSYLIECMCASKSADVFISTYYTTPLRTPSLSVVYDMIPERLNSDLGDRIWREKELTICHGRRHLCISERTRLDLLEFYPKVNPRTVEVAYCGVDAGIFAPSSGLAQKSLRSRLELQRPFYILVGVRESIKGYKNSRLFFESVSGMRGVDFDVLCVGGEPELQPWIADLVPKTCRVTHVELDDRDLAVAYGSAIALVYPSRYEGFGLPVIEAMACGCPVITTNLGSLPEAAGNAAYIINGNSTSEMTKALQAVRVPDIRERLILAGERQAAKFRWDDFADAVARNMQLIDAEAKAGKFVDIYSRWSELRMLQGEVDVKC